jgi:cephalosporin-C deacetylase
MVPASPEHPELDTPVPRETASGRRRRPVPRYDLPLDQLRSYLPSGRAPADLEGFWARTLAEARRLGSPPGFEPVDTGLTLVDTFDVTYSGYGGAPVRGWLHIPRSIERAPLIVGFHGYGGGRGLPHEASLWTLAGYAHLTVDARGQGATTRSGGTADPEGSGPAHAGFMTRGIEDPSTYYYRRVYTDAVLAVETGRRHPRIDGTRVALAGRSQGGGVALAVAALVTDVAAVLVDVPFLCDFPRATELAGKGPYRELVQYLKVHRDAVDVVLSTLAYFDGVTFASMATAPALFSVALMDETCPPSTVFAAHNAYAGPKDIEVYPYNDHEGGQAFHEAVQLRWLAEVLASRRPR